MGPPLSSSQKTRIGAGCAGCCADRGHGRRTSSADCGGRSLGRGPAVGGFLRRMVYRSRGPVGPSGSEVRGAGRQAPALKILAAGVPASRPAFFDRKLPRWRRTWGPRAGAGRRPHPSVGRAGFPERQPCSRQLASASRARSARYAPAAGADPAPPQDASGSTPRGQDGFTIVL
jgi:hypothetical protein